MGVGGVNFERSPHNLPSKKTKKNQKQKQRNKEPFDYGRYCFEGFKVIQILVIRYARIVADFA